MKNAFDTKGKDINRNNERVDDFKNDNPFDHHNNHDISPSILESP